MGAIKPKYGDCTKCDKKNVLLYRRHPPECEYCYKKGKQKQYAERSKNKPKKKKKAIMPVSKKRLEQLAEYRKKRDKYLEEHPFCEVHDCGKMSTNLHHKAGRVGELLTNEEYFMACCETCHPRRIHETDPLWAEKHGYIIRL